MKYFSILLFLLSFVSSASTNGVYLGKTRVIFKSLSESESLPVTNSSTTNTWLLQSWITDEHSITKKDNHFIITPPLYRLESDNTINLKINKLLTNFPTNKESLFYINVMAIPPMTENKEGNTKINFSVNNRVKMFYRPTSIDNETDIKKSYDRITIKKKNKSIVFTNPSPYYLTLTDIKYNGKTSNESGFMLSPFGNSIVPCTGACNNIKFKLINDFGGVTPEKNINL